MSDPICTPLQFLDHESFYLSFDNQLLVDLIRTDLAYLKSNWSLIGRPTIVLPVLGSMLGGDTAWEHSPIYKLLLILASGYSSGVRVKLGTMKDFFSTASMKKLNFVDPSDAGKWSSGLVLGASRERKHYKPPLTEALQPFIVASESSIEGSVHLVGCG